MLTRRHLLALAPATLVAGLLGRGVSARTTTRVAVPNNGLGALVAAEGGEIVSVVIDTALACGQIRIGDDAPVDVAAKLRLKGSGVGRDRFLDDARNATRVGSAIRDALVRVRPDDRARLETRHREWARPFARKALAWTRELEQARLGGHKVRDEYDRIYLLEWAGAVVDARGKRSPSGLAEAPAAPARPDLAAYEAYLDALVDAVG